MRVGVLITGASRGFGRCVAVDFAQQISAGDDLDIVRLFLPLSMNVHRIKSDALRAVVFGTNVTK
jgi:NAD(P)-dependent dehydrogenase (short-subunit alcohol dehydrogenase family)